MLFPPTRRIKPRFEHGVSRVVWNSRRGNSSPFLRFVIEDAEEPGADGGATLEFVQRREKRHEHVLREVFSVRLIEAQAASRPVQTA